MPAAAAPRFLDPALLARLATIELRARAVAQGFMAGMHGGAAYGHAIEFAEYRPYQPGDNPRGIDWKACARRDRLYVRQCEDETNQEAWLILDASASMGFGSHALTKWQYGAILAAALGCLLHARRDGVGLIVIDEGVRLEMPSRATRSHLVRLIGELEKIAPAGKTRLAEGLHQAAARIRRRSLVILISDLLDEPDEILSGLRHLRFGGNRVLVFQPLDPAELDFPYDEAALFVDPEDGRIVPARGDGVREDYLKALRAFNAQLAAKLGQAGIGHTLMNTGEPLDHALLAFFNRQKRFGV